MNKNIKRSYMEEDDDDLEKAMAEKEKSIAATNEAGRQLTERIMKHNQEHQKEMYSSNAEESEKDYEKGYKVTPEGKKIPGLYSEKESQETIDPMESDSPEVKQAKEAMYNLKILKMKKKSGVK